MNLSKKKEKELHGGAMSGKFTSANGFGKQPKISKRNRVSNQKGAFGRPKWLRKEQRKIAKGFWESKIRI